MLGTAAEEIAKSEEIYKNSNTVQLREQQENDFGLWGPYKFKMPEKEGKWDEVTANSPKILANKIIGLLSSSWMQLFIDVDDEMRKKRKAISATEQLANGCIWLADRALTTVPSGKSIQSSESFYTAIKGGTCKTVLLYSDGEKVISDIREYDPTYCQWIEGEKDILWFCHRAYVNKYFIEHNYKKKKEEGFKFGEPDSNGRILIYTFWDDKSWKTALNNEYIDEDDHNLGYIPVNIRSCGAVPYVQSEAYPDSMKYSWVSVFANNRDIYPLESKLLSIESSKAVESGKIKIAGEWDSVKSEGDLPQGLDKLGYATGGRNEIVMFDAAKGQKFGGMVQPPSNDVIDQFLTRVRGMDIIGSIDPIAFGQMTRSGSGALAAELRSAALEFINPFRECIEADFVWIAEECVKQFKNGDFDSMTIEGRDAKRNKFFADIKPKDIEEKRFECNLVADRLRDEIQELGAAIQKVSYGLSSRRTAMTRHNIVKDPDLEFGIMAQEKHYEIASNDPVLHNSELANYYKDQGNEEMALYHMKIAEVAIKLTIAGMMGGTSQSGNEEKKPPIVSPQMETGRVAQEPQNMGGM